MAHMSRKSPLNRGDEWAIRDHAGAGPPVQEEPQYQPSRRATSSTNWIPWEVECSCPSRPFPILFRGRLVRTWWKGDDGSHSREPWHFEPDELVIPIKGQTPGGASFRGAGLGGAYEAVRKHFTTRAALDPKMFGDPRQLPKPGRKGHPIELYAQWAVWYCDACATHGQKYMRPLQETARSVDPTNHMSTSAIRRIIDKAVELELIENRPGQGKAGGTPTAECLRLLRDMKDGEEP